MKAFPAFFQVLADPARTRLGRLQQFDQDLSNFDKRHPDADLWQGLDFQGDDAVKSFIDIQGTIQISNGYADMIDLVDHHLSFPLANRDRHDPDDFIGRGAGTENLLHPVLFEQSRILLRDDASPEDNDVIGLLFF
ncbi:MAG: hypothetical protein H6Q04_1598 [Acidobacteria bacterium]|nr:hypothetical protein [Acidobacteriota bacterium]